ncbi:hypothetical protein C8R45DRAFT_1097136 [Mycena sanguinolenta]|nr:hypothetical protein C8R45DRAFT_1097136 [Mycena sanguinolenta]
MSQPATDRDDHTSHVLASTGADASNNELPELEPIDTEMEDSPYQALFSVTPLVGRLRTSSVFWPAPMVYNLIFGWSTALPPVPWHINHVQRAASANGEYRYQLTPDLHRFGCTDGELVERTWSRSTNISRKMRHQAKDPELLRRPTPCGSAVDQFLLAVFCPHSYCFLRQNGESGRLLQEQALDIRRPRACGFDEPTSPKKSVKRFFPRKLVSPLKRQSPPRKKIIFSGPPSSIIDTRPPKTCIRYLNCKRVKRQEPLSAADLYLDEARPPTVAPTAGHQCGICEGVMLHPVVNFCEHSFCYVCIRLHLECNWTCPNRDCRVIFRQGLKIDEAEERSIVVDYPKRVDTSRVSYSFDGLRFPFAPVSGGTKVD